MRGEGDHDPLKATRQAVIRSLRERLLSIGLPSTSYEIDLTPGDGHARVALRSSAVDWRERVELVMMLLDMGGAFLFVRGSGNAVAQGLWLDDDPRNMDEVLDVARSCACFGVVWVGAPFRRLPILTSPHVPDSESALARLLSQNYARYSRPWVASGDYRGVGHPAA